MNVFDGLKEVRQFPAERQEAFLHYFQQKFRSRIYPVVNDVNIGFTFVAVLLDVVIVIASTGSPDAVHPESYLYLACIAFLGVCNRHTAIRTTYLAMTYTMFMVVTVFSYLKFIRTDGDIGVYLGYAWYMTSFGMIGISILHGLFAWFINFVLLYGSITLLFEPTETISKFTYYAGNWFTLFFLILTVGLSLFVRWIFRNVFALHFLLDERNETLSKTVQLLHATEDQLIQQQKHQALSHMASGLLHELVNPVNNALQALGFAKARSRDADVNDAIDDAMLNQKRIAAIISDLRAFAQDSAPAAREQVALDTLIDQALKLCAAELASIEIEREGRADKPVACFPNALTQVLVNLLLNASDALKERKKTGSAQITISVQCEAGLVRICLHDNGKGIAPEHLRRLAEPFYSIDKDGPNMGLGLSICQTIMSHHDGRMWVKSELGNWTEVCLEWPERVELVR